MDLKGAQFGSLSGVLLAFVSLCLALGVRWYDNSISMWDTCKYSSYDYRGLDDKCSTRLTIQNLFISSLTCAITGLTVFIYQACASEAMLVLTTRRRALRLIPPILFIIAALLIAFGIVVWEHNFVYTYSVRRFGFYAGSASALLMVIAALLANRYPLFAQERLAKAEAQAARMPVHGNVVYITSQTPTVVVQRQQPVIHHQQITIV